jgi:plastocyanin
LLSLLTLVLTASVFAPANFPERHTALVPSAMSGPAPQISVDYVNVTTTSVFTFVPDQFTVTPGALVHLVVTQAASFPHTFTLSPVANFTFPTSESTAELLAYFQEHVPLVNLSLGSTVGEKAFANFTAPPAGTYEFVCLTQGHFAQGMHGVMTSGGPPPSFAIPYGLIVGIVVVVAVVVGVAVGLWRRRISPTRPKPPIPPAP